MSKIITPAQIEQVKVAARRLKKSIPDFSHAKLLDISAYQLLGVASYHEAQTRMETDVSGYSGADETSNHENLKPDNNHPNEDREAFSTRKVTYAEYTGLTPAITVGHWHYFPENQALSFDGEFSPYVFFLRQLTTPVNLLDCIFQLNHKYWPQKMVDKHGICAHYQVKEFIELVDRLCRAYFDTSVQGVFCPSGNTRFVDWAAAIEQRGESELFIH